MGRLSRVPEHRPTGEVSLRPIGPLVIFRQRDCEGVITGRPPRDVRFLGTGSPLGAGPRWRPAELHLEGPAPGHAEEIAELAAGSTHFGAAADCLVFPRSILALPLPPAPSPARPSSLPLPDLDFVGSIRQTIRFLLELGELNLPNLAEVAGTSVRSLQRPRP